MSEITKTTYENGVFVQRDIDPADFYVDPKRPAYIEKRLFACRELEALRYKMLGLFVAVAAIRSGRIDHDDIITRHFPAFDAGSASRDDEVDALRAVLELAIEWDGCDAMGVDAVWLEQARAALEDTR